MKLRKETFELTVEDFNGETATFKVEHEGFKLRDEQASLIDNLIHIIRGEGKEDNFIPYNNFECHVAYNRIDKPKP